MKEFIRHLVAYLQSILFDALIFIWFFVFLILNIWFLKSGSNFTVIAISDSMLNTLFGVVATLSGALLGLIIAIVSISTQYSTYNFPMGREVISKERHSLELWLETNKLKNKKLYDKLSEPLTNLCQVSRMMPYISLSETRLKELRNTIIAAIETTAHYHDLNDSVLAISDAIFRMMISVFSAMISKQLIKSSFLVGIVLLGSVSLLILSGVTLSGVEILSGSDKLYWSTTIVWFFIFTLLIIFKIVSMYLKMVLSEIDKLSP